MLGMTARQPRRTRRRAPSASLPRPGVAAPAPPDEPMTGSLTGKPRSLRRPATPLREHHVTTDYRYIHHDLRLMLGIGIAVVAFIVAMSFVV